MELVTVEVGRYAYFWLSRRIQKQFHFAEIVASGHQRAVWIPTYRINIGAIGMLGPYTNGGEW